MAKRTTPDSRSRPAPRRAAESEIVEGPPPVDWQGKPLDCARCPVTQGENRALCKLGHACVEDRYARRIDRFFRWNESTAHAWLTHPYFEVRAIAVRFASLFRVTPL